MIDFSRVSWRVAFYRFTLVLFVLTSTPSVSPKVFAKFQKDQYVNHLPERALFLIYVNDIGKLTESLLDSPLLHQLPEDIRKLVLDECWLNVLSIPRTSKPEIVAQQLDTAKEQMHGGFGIVGLRGPDGNLHTVSFFDISEAHRQRVESHLSKIYGDPDKRRSRKHNQKITFGFQKNFVFIGETSAIQIVTKPQKRSLAESRIWKTLDGIVGASEDTELRVEFFANLVEISSVVLDASPATLKGTYHKIGGDSFVGFKCVAEISSIKQGFVVTGAMLTTETPRGISKFLRDELKNSDVDILPQSYVPIETDVFLSTSIHMPTVQQVVSRLSSAEFELSDLDRETVEKPEDLFSFISKHTGNSTFYFECPNNVRQERSDSGRSTFMGFTIENPDVAITDLEQVEVKIGNHDYPRYQLARRIEGCPIYVDSDQFLNAKIRFARERYHTELTKSDFPRTGTIVIDNAIVTSAVSGLEKMVDARLNENKITNTKWFQALTSRLKGASKKHKPAVFAFVRVSNLENAVFKTLLSHGRSVAEWIDYYNYQETRISRWKNVHSKVSAAYKSGISTDSKSEDRILGFGLYPRNNGFKFSVVVVSDN